jgi:hypothetical protein
MVNKNPKLENHTIELWRCQALTIFIIHRKHERITNGATVRQTMTEASAFSQSKYSKKINNYATTSSMRLMALLFEYLIKIKFLLAFTIFFIFNKQQNTYVRFLVCQGEPRNPLLKCFFFYNELITVCQVFQIE